MSHRLHSFERIILVCLVLATVFARPVAARIIYVSCQAPGGDGSDWAQAKRTIGEAMEIADAGDQIWVGYGTYREVVAFKSGVSLYGGFPYRSQSTSPVSWDHLTILDVSTANAGAPADHAVVMDGVTSVTLDGFMVTGGKADGSDSDAYGGGIWMQANDDTVCTASQCLISENQAQYGGGVYAGAHGRLALVDCQIWNNSASVNGGGIYASSADIELSDCTVAGNRATHGGGLAIDDADLNIAGSLIAANWVVPATGGGGGISCYPGKLTIRNSVVSANRAAYGGAINSGADDPVLVNTIVSGNQTGPRFAAGRPCFINCTISGNDAYGAVIGWYEGAIFVNTIFDSNETDVIGDYDDYDSAIYSSEFLHCLFDNNGGGISSTPQGVHNLNFMWGGDCVVGNPRFAMNGDAATTGTWTVAPAFDSLTSQTTLVDANAHFTTGSLVGRLIHPNQTLRRQALITSNTATAICVMGDVSDTTPTGATYRLADYHLLDGSNALDRGLSNDIIGEENAVPALDIDGEARPGGDAHFDIGADEAPAGHQPEPDSDPPVSNCYLDLPWGRNLVTSATLNIAWQASDLRSGIQYVELYYRRDGGPWTKYGDTYTAAIPFVCENAGGNGYYEFYTRASDNAGNVEAAPVTPDAQVRFCTVFNGARIYVDRDATGLQTGESWADALTSISLAAQMSADFGIEVWAAEGTYPEYVCLSGGEALYGGFAGNEAERSQRDPAAHVTIIDPAFQPDPFGVSSPIYMTNTTPVIVDGFQINVFSSSGSGIRLSAIASGVSAGGTIAHCRISGHGGGNGIAGDCYPGHGYLTVSDCTISSVSRGISIGTGIPTTIQNCVVERNAGTGIQLATNCTAKIQNCIVQQNMAGGITIFSLGLIPGQAVIEDCIIRNNSTSGSDAGGGVYCGYTSITLQRCTITGNRSSSGHGGAVRSNYNRPTLRDCIITSNTTDYGSCLYFYQATPLLENCEIAHNRFTGYPAYPSTIPVAVIDSSETSSALTVRSCQITDNIGEWGSCSGIRSYCYPTAAQILVQNTTIADNQGCGGILNNNGHLDVRACAVCSNSSVGILASCSSIRIADSEITGNNGGSSYAGGVDANAQSVRMERCTIAENISDDTGGVKISSTDTTVTQCVFRGNRGGNYGGIWFNGSSLRLLDSSIIGNVATLGLRAAVYYMGGNILVSNCSINFNDGYGLVAYGGTVENCRLHNNQSWAVYTEGSVLDRCSVTGNGGGIYCNYNSNISNCIISGNTVLGGARAGNGSKWTNCLITGNHAPEGGAINLIGSPWITNCTIADNDADTSGGGIFCYGPSPRITNTIFYNNSKCAVYEKTSSSNSIASHNLFFANPDGDYFRNDPESSGTLTGAAAINDMVTSATGNIDGDPHFFVGDRGSWSAAPAFDALTSLSTLTDAGASFIPGRLAGSLIQPNCTWKRQLMIVNNTTTTIQVMGRVSEWVANGDIYRLPDYHLLTGSPAIDAGTSVSTALVDWENEPRPAGADFDIGADEWTDSDGDGLPDYWETAWGFDPQLATNSNGASGNPDGDQSSNFNEYIGGTNPLDRHDWPGSPVWVDFAYAGVEHGTRADPFNTLNEAVQASPSQATVNFKGYSSTTARREVLRINKPLRIQAIGGPVRIGRN